MSHALHDKTDLLLDDLPRYYREDEYVLATLDVLARELQRVEDLLVHVRDKLTPQNADDTHGLLGLWEFLLNLPVEPVGVTLAARRNKVLAHLRKRDSGAGSDWVAVITEGLGSQEWVYEEGPGDYQVTVRLPYAESSFTGAQVEALVEAVTPAHIDLVFAYDEGFILGVSRLGDAL